MPRSIRDFETWLVELFRQHATRAQRRLIKSCTDLGKPDTWFDRSLTPRQSPRSSKTKRGAGEHV